MLTVLMLPYAFSSTNKYKPIHSCIDAATRGLKLKR